MFANRHEVEERMLVDQVSLEEKTKYESSASKLSLAGVTVTDARF